MTISLFVNEKTVLSFASFVANITRICSAIVMNFKVLFHISHINCNFAAEKTLDTFHTRKLGGVLHDILISSQTHLNVKVKIDLTEFLFTIENILSASFKKSIRKLRTDF